MIIIENVLIQLHVYTMAVTQHTCAFFGCGKTILFDKVTSTEESMKLLPNIGKGILVSEDVTNKLSRSL